MVHEVATSQADPEPGPPARLLNIGCGRHYDLRWENLDLASNDPNVMIHDVTRGIPFAADEFDAVYHSHILEHLKPELGEQLIAECYRVMKPNGILRIVVPDLERIAELYLQTHARAWQDESGAQTDYEWMKLELLDQLVRDHSGGRMGRYMANQEIKNSEFVRWRVGTEYEICRGLDRTGPRVLKRGWRSQVSQLTRSVREVAARLIVRCLLGRNGESALNEGLFRSRGEIHRWMYDRHSLRRLCAEQGFVDFRICGATESGIHRFAEFQLDTMGDLVRKPDSLFIECRKPALSEENSAKTAA
jgi:SAM-dependent methyltransferase